MAPSDVCFSILKLLLPNCTLYQVHGYSACFQTLLDRRLLDHCRLRCRYHHTLQPLLQLDTGLTGTSMEIGVLLFVLWALFSGLFISHVLPGRLAHGLNVPGYIST